MVPGHLFLIGYRGSGKTTTGRILAERLARPFLDTDAWIESHARKTIPQIFAEQGEEAFRDLESLAIARLVEREPTVVALGGGAILRLVNRERLKQLGRTVWLSADLDHLKARIASDEAQGKTRPSLTGSGTLEEMQWVYSQREPLYREASDWIVETDTKAPEQLAQEIADWYAQSQRNADR